MYEEIWSKIRREDVQDMVQKLIQIPTEFHDRDFSKFDYKPMAEFMLDEYKKWGMETKTLGKPGFPCPYGRLRGTVGKPSILITGHYNTVAVGDRSEWIHDPFGGEIVGDKIYGRGASDQKGGIAASMVAIKALAESGVELKGDIIAMYIPGEGAFEHSINWLAENHPEKIKSDLCLMSEGGGLPTIGTGLMWTEIVTKGEMIHTPGVRPRPGVRNALSDLLKLLDAMEKTEEWMTWEPEPMLGPDAKPICSVTVIEAGSKVNNIPDSARVEVDIRMMPSQSKEGILKELDVLIEKVKAETPTLEVEKINPYHYTWPNVKIEKNHPAAKIIQEVVEEIYSYRVEPSVGGTLLCAAADLMPTSVCGHGPRLPEGRRGGGGGHGLDEWVSIDYLYEKTKYMAALFHRLLTSTSFP